MTYEMLLLNETLFSY